MQTKLFSFFASALLAVCFFIACNKDDNATSAAAISLLNCSSAAFSTTPTVNTVYSGTAMVPYTDGNGAAYAAGSSISSTDATGLMATLSAGTLATGDGNLMYTISGTATSTGTASFPISIGGQSCTLTVIVNAATSSNCDAQTGVAKLACLCDAFKATLTSAQITTLQQSYTFANIKTWSNLPAGAAAHKGIKLGDLTATQLAAAKAIVKEMSGTTANEGWDEVQQIWLADDYLSVNSSNALYGSGNYYLAFFGTPERGFRG